MSRQRIHNSRAGRGSGNSGASWISYSDMMAALVLVFVLILSMSLHQYFIMLESKTKELDQQKLLITNQQLKLDEQTLQIAAQQVTMDHQNAQIAVIMTQLDEKQTALEEAYIVLGENQAQLEEAQKTLAGKEAQLIILQQELANKESALNAAIQVLNSKTDKIEDMVGMKAEIIAELSSSLSRANLSAAVDKNTGDIVLDSAVLFKTNSSDIMSDGKALLNRFIPVYLEVLLRPEYADYLGQIVIEGHTDDSGSYEHNMKLSQERAYEVMMYVLGMYSEGSQERELLQKLLTATGRSKSDLIYYEGTNIVNQAASRRVEFKFSLKDAEMIEEMNRLLQAQ
ncbi:MAG: OmpA family protein [Clostridiales bacterium]|nr:OmpA family protein [Clostridiales bacterium]